MSGGRILDGDELIKHHDELFRKGKFLSFSSQEAADSWAKIHHGNFDKKGQLKMANGNQKPEEQLNLQGADQEFIARQDKASGAPGRMLARGQQAADQARATRGAGPVAGAGSLPSGTEEEMRQQALNAATDMVADTVDALSDGTTASKALEKRAEQEGERDFGSILLNALGGFVTGFATVYTGKDFLNPYLSTQAERRKEAAARIGKFEKLAMVIQGAKDPAQVEQDVLKVLGMEGASPEVIEEVVGRMTSEDADFLLGEVYKKRDARLKEAGDEEARLQNAQDNFRMAGLGEPSQDASADQLINAVGANERKKEEEAKSRSKYSADSNEALNNLRAIPVADTDLFEDAVNQAEARIAPEYRGQFRDSVDSLRAARVETLKNQQLAEADTHIKGRTFQKGYSQHTQPQKTRIDGELKSSYDEAQTFLEGEDELQRMVDSKLISQESAEKIKELVGGTLLDKGYAEWAAGASGEDLNLFLQHFGREGDLLQQIRAAKQGLPLLDEGLESLNETLSATGLGITLTAKDVSITRDGEIIPSNTSRNEVYTAFSSKVSGTEDVESLRQLKDKVTAYYGPDMPPQLSAEIDSRMAALTILGNVAYEAPAVQDEPLTEFGSKQAAADYATRVVEGETTTPIFTLTQDVFKPSVESTVEELDKKISDYQAVMDRTVTTDPTLYEQARDAQKEALRQRIVAETAKTQTTVRNFQRDLVTDMADGQIRLDLVASQYADQGPLGNAMEGMAAFSDTVQNATSFEDIAKAYYTNFLPQVGVQVANTERGRSNAEVFYADAMDKHYEISDDALTVLDDLDESLGYNIQQTKIELDRLPAYSLLTERVPSPSPYVVDPHAKERELLQQKLDRVTDPEKVAQAKLEALGVPYPKGGVVKFMDETGQKPLIELPLAEMSNEELADYAAFYLMNR